VAKASKPAKVEEPLDKKVSEASSSPKVPSIEIPHALSVRQLADLLQTSAVDIIKRLMRNGIMANINQVIEYEAAAAVAADFGYEALPQPRPAQKTAGVISEIKRQQLQGAELGGL
jgi:hypothetical protein